ncbi:MAG: hypothetical protein GXO25_04605 [Euryarchaeota archaeon]|nr:hypothetical protein [Euryarchaeota archaeon]
MEFVEANGIAVHNNGIENTSSYGLWVDSESQSNLFHTDCSILTTEAMAHTIICIMQTYHAGHNY